MRPRSPTHSVDPKGGSPRLGGDSRLGNDRNDPARRVAGLNFHDRMNQPRDERSLYGQVCLFAAMLVIAEAYRDFWISRFESWHVHQVAVCETVPGLAVALPSSMMIAQSLDFLRTRLADEPSLRFTVFSISVRRFIISSVIGGSSNQVGVSNPTLPANRR